MPDNPHASNALENLIVQRDAVLSRGVFSVSADGRLHSKESMVTAAIYRYNAQQSGVEALSKPISTAREP